MYIYIYIYIYTVKLANKDRPWEVKKRSLFTGGLCSGG